MSNNNKENFNRDLKNRHIQMIAIGCAIGTGLFYGSARSISKAGPSIILAFAVMGCLLYFVMRALAEMTVHEPVAGSFSYFANKYVSPYLGFMSGWNYWFNYIAVCLVELSIVGLYMKSFEFMADVPFWLISLIFWAVFMFLNFMPVKNYGEIEFWFTIIKVSTIVLMIVFGFWLVFFGFGDTPAVGFKNLTAHGGFFPNGISGFVFGFVMVAFSFGGIELFAMTAAEAQDPQKTLPKAVNNIIWRILIFYVFTMIIIIALTPWNTIDGNSSPFVQVFNSFGFKAAAIFINIVVITACLSALNSALYASARMMYSLAEQGIAPKVFAKTNKNKIPVPAVLLSSALTLVVVALNYITSKDGAPISNVFLWCAGLATAAIVVNWTLIMVIQIAFRKKMDADGVKLSYKLPLYPYINYVAIACFIGLIALMFTKEVGMIHDVLVVGIWFIFLNIAWFVKKARDKK